MKRFFSIDSNIVSEQVNKKRKISSKCNGLNSSSRLNDHTPEECVVLKNKKLEKHRKTITSSTIIQEESTCVPKELVVKQELHNSYSDSEESFSSNEGTSDFQKNENFENDSETINKYVHDLLNRNSTCKQEQLQNDYSSSSDEINSDKSDFEEALQHCSNNREKSNLVERKKLEKNCEELMTAEISLLKGLKIDIPWVVPACHRIETRVSSYPTKQQKEQFAQLQIKFATGPYTKEEDAKIKENWSEFCKAHDLAENPKLFLTFLWDGKSYLNKQQRINFVRYLAKEIDHRPLWSIYGRFQLLFSETQKGNFTSKEDDIIMAFYQNSDFPNKNSALALVLNRTRASIKNRYNILKAEDSKFKFTNEKDQEFLDNLIAVSGKKNISDLKDVEFTGNNFKQISSTMNIPYAKLKRRWELVLKARLFADEFTHLHDIREKLINLLSEKKFTDRREINWKQLSKTFDNVTSYKLYKIFTDLIHSYVPDHRKKSLPDIINCLKHAKNHMVNKKLKKYNYKGNKLILTDS